MGLPISTSVGWAAKSIVCGKLTKFANSTKQAMVTIAMSVLSEKRFIGTVRENGNQSWITPALTEASKSVEVVKMEVGYNGSEASIRRLASPRA